MATEYAKVMIIIEAVLKCRLRLNIMFFAHVSMEVMEKNEFLTTTILGAAQFFGLYIQVETGNVMTHYSPVNGPKFTFTCVVASQVRDSVSSSSIRTFDSMASP